MSSWENVPTGGTHFRNRSSGEFVEMTTADGNTYRMNAASNPIWHSSDTRLAVHKLGGTNDCLIEKTEGGTNIFFFRVGQTNYVKLAREGSPEWNDATRPMRGATLQGY